MKLSQRDIIEAFSRLKRKSLSTREMMTALRFPPGAKKVFHVKLRELERQGVLKRIRGGRYVLAEKSTTREGIVRLGKRGDGRIELPDGKSLRVAPHNLGGAFDGDRVRYVLLRRDRMNRLNGKVIEIVERTAKIIVGQFQHGRGENFVLPIDATFQQPVVVTGGESGSPKPGDWVAVRIDAHTGRMKSLRGEITEVLGAPSDPRVEMKASV